MKTKLLGLGMVLGSIAAFAPLAFATDTMTPADVSTQITDGIGSLSTSGGAILAAVVVVIAAIILFRFGVKWAKRSVK